MPLTVRSVPVVDAADTVASRFGSTAWPTAAVRWGALWSRSCPEVMDLEVLVCERAGACVGFAVRYRVPRLELFRFLGGIPLRLNAWLRRRGGDPFTLCITYVDLPFADEEAVFVHPDEAEPQRVREALVEAALDDPHAHAVCIRATKGSPLAAAMAPRGLIPIDLPPGTSVDLAGGYDGWLARRTGKRRGKIRQTERAFRNAGGRIVRLDDPRPHAQRLVELFDRTVQAAVDRGGIEVPSKVSPAFFDALAELPEDLGTVLAAEVEGRIVGYLVLLAGPGCHALVGPCGLDYVHAPPARAYFAMWPHAVAWASERGCRTLAFGSEAYTYKERLGAVRVATHFHAGFRSRPLRVLAPPLTRALSAFLGRIDDD